MVSDQEFESEIDSLNAVVNRPKFEVLTKVIARGRGNVKEIDGSIRALVAQEAILGTPSKVIQEEFGVSASSVSAYKNDKTSTSSDKIDENLARSNSDTRDIIKGKAFNKLISAIEAIDENKLAESSPKTAAQVAQQMSSVIKNISPDSDAGKSQIGQVIIYRPRMKEEEDYDIIDVQKLEV